VAMALSAASCRRIHLYDPDGGVFLELHLDIDYRLNPSCPINAKTDEAFGNLAYGKIPTMVAVFFYDMDTHDKVYETFLPPEGGFIDLDPGAYDVIAYGMGSEYSRITEAANRGLVRAYTEEKGSLVDLGGAYGNQPMIKMPDQVYAGRVSGLVVPVRPKDSGITRLEMDLTPMVLTYSFIAYNISGLENVSSFQCFISGQAPDRFLWDEHFTVTPVVVDFTMTSHPDTWSAQGVFNTFGKLPEYTSTAYMYVEVINKAGATFHWSYDVTDQFNNPDNSCHTIVVDDEIDIPAGDDTGVTPGFGPVVTPWVPEIFDIPVS
jgi:hypothetical protein